MDKITEIPIAKLISFENHPFHVKHDEELDKLKESIEKHGILSPLIARPKENGKLEIVSGHRRKLAAELLDIDKLPVIIRSLSDEEATILMVDSNIQRENLLPSEKAYAYKMKLDALNHQGKATSDQVGQKFSRSLLSEQSNESETQIFRYIRLTNLVPPILEMVDNKRIAFSPAVELSYLTAQEQISLYELIQAEDCTPNLSQSVRLKKLSQSSELTTDKIFDILSEEKANQKEQIHFPAESIREYFPKGYTTEQMEKAIIKILEQLEKKRQRKDMER